MANPHRGEVGFECGGQSYVLRLSTNALCELEEKLNLNVMGIADLMADVKSLRISTIRTVFWAALHDQRPDITLKIAGEIMYELGGGKVMQLISAAMSASFPEAEGGDARPPVPGQTGPAGNGQDFSGAGENSALATNNSGEQHRETSSAPLRLLKPD